MSQDRLFLDTVFIQAILNPRDQYHSSAMQLFPRVKNAQEVWTTEAILMEVGNALSTYDHHKVAAFIKRCYKTDNISIVNITPPHPDPSPIWRQFASRPDEDKTIKFYRLNVLTNFPRF